MKQFSPGKQCKSEDDESTTSELEIFSTKIFFLNYGKKGFSDIQS